MNRPQDNASETTRPTSASSRWDGVRRAKAKSGSVMTAAAESDPLAWANVVDGPHRTVVGIRLAGSDGSLFELRTMPHAGLKRCCLRMPDLPARLVAQVHFNPLTGRAPCRAVWNCAWPRAPAHTRPLPTGAPTPCVMPLLATVSTGPSATSLPIGSHVRSGRPTRRRHVTWHGGGHRLPSCTEALVRGRQRALPGVSPAFRCDRRAAHAPDLVWPRRRRAPLRVRSAPSVRRNGYDNPFFWSRVFTDDDVL